MLDNKSIQTINNVNITGKLVKVELEKKKIGQDDESIAGNIILRTTDGSEHNINYFAYKYKKDKETKQFTSEENSLFKGYETIIDEFKSLENNPEDADIVKIGAGEFGVQDYVSKQDGSLKTFNDLKAKFANRLNAQEIETTPQHATFEVQGIVTKLAQELKKNEPTGNGEIHLDVLGYQGTITPVKLIVPEAIVEAFGQAGFYEGGVAKFSGKILNTVDTETIVEKQAFGEDLVKTITTTVKRYEVTGGTPQGTIYDLKLTDEIYEAAKSKRRLKLQEIKNKAENGASTNQQGFTPAPTQNTSAPVSNPFAKATATNPFAKK